MGRYRLAGPSARHSRAEGPFSILCRRVSVGAEEPAGFESPWSESSLSASDGFLCGFWETLSSRLPLRPRRGRGSPPQGAPVPRRAARRLRECSHERLRGDRPHGAGQPPFVPFPWSGLGRGACWRISLEEVRGFSLLPCSPRSRLAPPDEPCLSFRFSLISLLAPTDAVAGPACPAAIVRGTLRSSSRDSFCESFPFSRCERMRR